MQKVYIRHPKPNPPRALELSPDPALPQLLYSNLMMWPLVSLSVHPVFPALRPSIRSLPSARPLAMQPPPPLPTPPFRPTLDLSTSPDVLGTYDLSLAGTKTHCIPPLPLHPLSCSFMPCLSAHIYFVPLACHVFLLWNVRSR